MLVVERMSLAFVLQGRGARTMVSIVQIRLGDNSTVYDILGKIQSWDVEIYERLLGRIWSQ